MGKGARYPCKFRDKVKIYQRQVDKEIAKLRKFVLKSGGGTMWWIINDFTARSLKSRFL